MLRHYCQGRLLGRLVNPPLIVIDSAFPGIETLWVARVYNYSLYFINYGFHRLTFDLVL